MSMEQTISLADIRKNNAQIWKSLLVWVKNQLGYIAFLEDRVSGVASEFFNLLFFTK